MRKIGSFLLSAVMLATVAVPANAATPVRLFVSGSEVRYDVAPLVENGRTLVPLRGLSETLGFFVHFDEQAQTIKVSKGLSSITLRVGSSEVTVGGDKYQLDVPVKAAFNRTFVPLRFLSERLGSFVHWDAAASTVNITPDGARNLLTRANWVAFNNLLVDRRTVTEMVTTVETSGSGSNFRMELPVTTDLQVRNREGLLRETVGGQSPMTVQTVAKGGRIYSTNPETGALEQVETYEPTSPSAFMGSELFAASANPLASTDMINQATVTYGGYRQLDGVETTRVDVNLGEALAKAIFDQTVAHLPQATMLAGSAKMTVYVDANTGRSHLAELTVTAKVQARDEQTGQPVTVNATVTGSNRNLYNPGPIAWPTLP